MNADNNKPNTDADLDDIFNLGDFEADFAAGKFAHLVKNVKTAKPKTAKTAVRVSPRGGLEEATYREPRLQIADPAVAAVYLYRHLDCNCCGGRTTFVSAKMIKYATGLRTSYKHLGVGYKGDSLHTMFEKFVDEGKLEAMEAVEKIEYCQTCIQMILMTGNINHESEGEQSHDNSNIGDSE